MTHSRISESPRHQMFLKFKKLQRMAWGLSFFSALIFLFYWVSLTYFHFSIFLLLSCSLFFLGIFLFFLLSYSRIRYTAPMKLTKPLSTPSLYASVALKFPILQSFFIFEGLLIFLDLLEWGLLLLFHPLLFQRIWEIFFFLRYIVLLLINLFFLVCYFRNTPKHILYTPLLLRS